MIFYGIQRTRNEPSAQERDDFETDTYLWTERAKSAASRIAREHVAQRKLATALSLWACCVSLILGAALWPQHESDVITKRVHFVQCDEGLLTIYGNRCN